MSLTPYHARYYALLLSRRAKADDTARYLPALASANIDLHPHQIEAALFASRSPYREGVILADEEGLGKTIEAGIALLQASLEGRKRLLVLCPPALRDHWMQELAEKFSFACVGLDEAGDDEGVVLLTYAEAQRKAERLAAVAWDICVFDEAHLLANAGLSEHTQANAIRAALAGKPKLLLTATPMQNSVMDLYHLVRFVDETVFVADPEAFRARYVGQRKHRQELAERAQRICQRTLRKHALTMPALRRIVRTFLVAPSEEETALSKRLSMYFHREPLLAFPKVKEHEIRLTYWKLMASSWRALAESLEKVAARLEHVPGALDELQELRAIADQARALEPGTRARAFLDALEDARHQQREAGAPDRVVVFSERRTTLAFLADWLEANGYAGRVAIHQPGAAGKKALEAFAGGEADILLATDAAGIGVDLSHCAIVVNYDLPWNVQKSEQRISRCHRYGQQHDVLVLNFLDPANRADRRLYDSLNQKLKKFDALFGQSETVLGHVSDPGNDTPEEALRPADVIHADQKAVRAAKRQDIDRQLEQAEADLLSHFDDAVRERFRQYGQTIPRQLDQLNRWLWEITRARLHPRAVFNDADRSFVLDRSPYPDLRLSRITFGMDKARPLAERYRLNHPLAKRVLADCLEGPLERGRLTLKARGAFAAGMAGELGLWLVGAMNEVACETRPVLCGVLDDGAPLDHEQCTELLKLPVVAWDGGRLEADGAAEMYRGRVWRDGTEAKSEAPLCGERLAALRNWALEAARARFITEQDAALSEHLDLLRCWAKDEEAALSARLDEGGKRIADLREQASAAGTFAGQFALNREALKRQKARRADEERLARLAVEVRRKRDELMDAARARSTARFWEREMFVTRFRVADGRGAEGERSGT